MIRRSRTRNTITEKLPGTAMKYLPIGALAVALVSAPAAAGSDPAPEKVRAVRLFADSMWIAQRCDPERLLEDHLLPVVLAGLTDDDQNAVWAERIHAARTAYLDGVAERDGLAAACSLAQSDLGDLFAPSPPLESTADGRAIAACADAIRQQMTTPDSFRPTAPAAVAHEGPTTWHGFRVPSLSVVISFRAAGPADLFYSPHSATCRVAVSPADPSAFRLIDLAIDDHPAVPVRDWWEKVRLFRRDPATTDVDSSDRSQKSRPSSADGARPSVIR